ncbi:hypothetical protein ABBQ38_007959 [Trebouxia sp. C0009 RCD-2024]
MQDLESENDKSSLDPSPKANFLRLVYNYHNLWTDRYVTVWFWPAKFGTYNCAPCNQAAIKPCCTESKGLLTAQPHPHSDESLYKQQAFGGSLYNASCLPSAALLQNPSTAVCM